jgi:hypothetical protein
MLLVTGKLHRKSSKIFQPIPYFLYLDTDEFLIKFQYGVPLYIIPLTRIVELIDSESIAFFCMFDTVNFQYNWCIIIAIQPLGRSGQRTEPSQAPGMALVCCILGKFLRIVCHCFPQLIYMELYLFSTNFKSVLIYVQRIVCNSIFRPTNAQYIKSNVY